MHKDGTTWLQLGSSRTRVQTLVGLITRKWQNQGQTLVGLIADCKTHALCPLSPLVKWNQLCRWDSLQDARYLVGHKVHLGFPVASYGKTHMKYLAK